MDYRELPEEFLNKMRSLLGEEFEAYRNSLSEPPGFGLRVNTLKCTPEAFRELAPWQTEPIPWLHNGFYLGDGVRLQMCAERRDREDEIRPSRHPYYAAGLYYLQEPSAMTPAALLPVEPGDRVLDLCAAPGGKSTELAAKLEGTGLLFANDISNSRAKALLKNLELSGAGPICVSSEAPEKLSLYLEGFFDKILVDAPCSGEGMFRRDPEMVKSYRERGPETYPEVQLSIAREAVKMLRPGGLLLYSTCTFDRREDEGVIGSLRAEFPELSPVELPKCDGFAPGIGLPECVRLFPHRIRGEGHFIALLRKAERAASETATPGGSAGKLRGGSAEDPSGSSAGKLRSGLAEDPSGSSAGKLRGSLADYPAGGPAGSPSEIRIPAAVTDFLARVQKTFEPERMYLKNDCVYYLPEPLTGAGRSLLKNIRYLRTGLFLGELRRDRFEPSQALAMYLKREEFPDRLELAAGDERVLRYLKGETLALTGGEQSGPSGWLLVCVDGFPLGWGKKAGVNLKNKYYPGWRRQ